MNEIINFNSSENNKDTFGVNNDILDENLINNIIKKHLEIKSKSYKPKKWVRFIKMKIKKI